MKIIKATPSDAGSLADMNKRLIEDERHPNPMNLEQLTQRMSDWLENEYNNPNNRFQKSLEPLFRTGQLHFRFIFIVINISDN